MRFVDRKTALELGAPADQMDDLFGAEERFIAIHFETPALKADPKDLTNSTVDPQIKTSTDDFKTSTEFAVSKLDSKDSL